MLFHKLRYIAKWFSPVAPLLRNRRSSMCTSASPATLFCEKLATRKLLRIQGKDTLPFLQGLITNDTRHLEDDSQTSVSLHCIYTMLLNNLGRTLYDAIIYKVKQNSDLYFLLECDAEATNDILKIIKLYKLRKDVNATLANDLCIWALHPLLTEPVASTFNTSPAHGSTLGSTSGFNMSSTNFLEGEMVLAFRDPRLQLLGHRLIVKDNLDLLSMNKNWKPGSDAEQSYALLRSKLGIGEGKLDHPPGACFPMECNLDYLHGVSFHKGCYIGQELTARTYHTGVIRKRLMPIVLQNFKGVDFQSGVTVEDEKGRNVGKLRSTVEQYGIALLRVEETLKAQNLKFKGTNVTLTTCRPGWWPMEVAKHSLSSTGDS